MSAIAERKNQIKFAESIFRRTHFSKVEVENLLVMFSQYTNHKEKMDRNTFRDILHNRFSMTDDVLMDRVFKAFDTKNDSTIDTEEWIMGLSVFLRGCLEEKTKFCFDVYDMNGDSYITKEEAQHFLKESIRKGREDQTSEEDPEESIRDLVEVLYRTVFQKSDSKETDNKISLDQFRQAVEKDDNLLEVMGQCLPVCKNIDDFCEDFKEKPAKDSPSVYKSAQQKRNMHNKGNDYKSVLQTNMQTKS